MVEVTVTIEVNDEEMDDSHENIARNIEENLRDAIGHCPYPATIMCCVGKKKE